MYGFHYQIASSEETLNQQLQLFFNHNESPAILEVFTPTRDNDKILLQFFKELV
jgi:2-succinyl-5-enolpyruvyl-6-hydroxy-3-cyclohexene-1-carboxylate synthase